MLGFWKLRKPFHLIEQNLSDVFPLFSHVDVQVCKVWSEVRSECAVTLYPHWNCVLFLGSLLQSTSSFSRLILNFNHKLKWGHVLSCPHLFPICVLNDTASLTQMQWGMWWNCSPLVTHKKKTTKLFCELAWKEIQWNF